ncbi:siphovirus Gp157 family protein [Rodentibacter caecimuris]|uniref:siphovirus Gp157 family protein n=1 Tax=Rodentibacter caecimuris TaxID=1796644 RepID=UPI002119C791|nr:siphovirus Gp157 family protein [Rodentibacter heylii]MCQ9124334.1 siphovirus Gp157 family protein [Rodentibacter heylii]
MKLYEITEQYENLAELLNNPEFAENADVQKALDTIQEEFNQKAERVVHVIKNAEGDIEVIDAEIKRLQAMKKQRQNGIEGIKNYLKLNMAKTDSKSIKCPLFSISYREQKESAVELDDDLFLANNLDEDLVNMKITPNKTEIKKRLKAGEMVIGAKLVDSQILTIK